MARYDKNAAALQRVIQYCDRVFEARNRFGASYETFASDTDYQSCCSMYVFQIGECSIQISEAVKASNPDVPWQKIKGMRNIFAHNYEMIQTRRLWDTMQHDLPKLREGCLRILMNLGYNLDNMGGDKMLDGEVT